MEKYKALPLVFVVLFSLFAVLSFALAVDNSVHETVFTVRVAVTPLSDDSMTNPDHQLLGFYWHTTINYYINPSNNYGFKTTSVVNTITASANTWDTQTNAQVFNYKGTTTKTAGKRDRYNVVSWGRYQAGVIAVTYIWYSGNQIIETDCRMNTYYRWSLSGQSGRMDVQNIMTHEFGHWCGLADLYSDADYWLTMYGYSNYAITYQRTLGVGDINGLQAVYGP
jgi:hypothetical protein